MSIVNFQKHRLARAARGVLSEFGLCYGNAYVDREARLRSLAAAPQLTTDATHWECPGCARWHPMSATSCDHCHYDRSRRVAR